MTGTLERKAALWRAASSLADLVLPAVRRPFRLSTLSDHVGYWDLSTPEGPVLVERAG